MTLPGLQEPLPRLLERVLRDLVIEQNRQCVAMDTGAPSAPSAPGPTVHVGIPGQSTRTFDSPAPGELDHALRIEVIEAMARSTIARGQVPLVWLTRSHRGPDLEDLAWAAAACAAGAELGVRLDLVVVTRRAWSDPRSGTGRTWVRLRADRHDSPSAQSKSGRQASGGTAP